MRIIAKCFNCPKHWDISMLSAKLMNVKCPECGGYVITNSGKVQTVIDKTGEMKASILDMNKVREMKRAESKDKKDLLNR